MAHLHKARVFYQHNDYVQSLHFAELALTKLKLLKDRPLEALDDAMTFKTTSLKFLGRFGEAMENAKERYTLWAMANIRNPRSIWAAFDLIDCCINMNEYVDAELFARTAYEIINERTDNIIPVNIRQHTLARGAYFLAKATCELAKAGGIAPEAKQAAVVKAIAHAREALEINTQLYGAESVDAANDMIVLADALDHFNGVDDDEVLRLYEQAKAIYSRVQGSSSPNVASCENNLGAAYLRSAIRARAAHDVDRVVANLLQAIPHYGEAARIFRTTNHAAGADVVLGNVTRVQVMLQEVEAERAAAVSVTAAESRA